jgi:hypothetical protein
VTFHAVSLGLIKASATSTMLPTKPALSTICSGNQDRKTTARSRKSLVDKESRRVSCVNYDFHYMLNELYELSFRHDGR